MKKLSYLFVIALAFIGMSTVKADTLTYNYLSDWYDSKNSYISNSNKIISFYDRVMSYYSSYVNDYPYYYIVFNLNGDSSSMQLFAHSSLPYVDIEEYWDYPHQPVIKADSSSYFYVDCDETSCSSRTTTLNNNNTFSGFFAFNTIYRHYFYSNFNLYFSTSSIYDTITVNAYQDYPSLTINNNSIIPPFHNVLELNIISDPNSVNSTYQEINLNNYAYIALSLKNYNQTEAFSTNIYTKGQLCITPVYDYGLKEKTEYYNGYQVDRCSPVYNDFTPVRTYILDQDLEHHAIYYLKAYDTNIENKVKIDISVFDVSLITNENANSPSVIINGRSYPTIPYNDLSSTSTESEEEGYISGQVTNILDSFNSNSFSDLFSNPLNVLKSVWSAIVSFLTLISTFIALLPPTMQAFLYMAFSIAIILGIIKILL